MDVRYMMNRDELIGKQSHWQVSNFGMAKLQHHYPTDLLETIKTKALEIKEEQSENKHLNLRYIRSAQKLIPEIMELFYLDGRLERLSEIAGCKLEEYPFSVITTAITFMGPDDGTVAWHADGVPITELIALEVDDVEGGDLELYQGDFEAGFAAVKNGEEFSDDQLIHLRHEVGCSMFGQFMRVLHRTQPMTRGSRITLTLNHRSADAPYIDDNPMYYLAADNPDFDWAEEYVNDVRNRQLPAYLQAQPA